MTLLTEKLTILLDEANINILEEEKEKLVNFVLLLNKWNKTYNLTSIKDPNEMLIKHIMDSLIISPYLKGNNFIDVGTGPGLPGIPLSIINSSKYFYLIDSLGKRIRFIKQVGHDINISNIKPIQTRIEEFTEITFDGVITRAFSSINKMLDVCSHLINEKGLFYALKGIIKKEEIESIPSFYSIVDVINLNVPKLDSERNLVIIKKN